MNARTLTLSQYARMGDAERQAASATMPSYIAAGLECLALVMAAERNEVLLRVSPFHMAPPVGEA